MKFFRNLPNIAYNNIETKNILLSSKIIREVLSKKEAFYPYIIKDGERADTLAYNYYGDSNYAWLIYYTNNIFDPYYQWPLDYTNFLKYIRKKYKKSPDASKQDIMYYEYNGIGGNVETEGDVERKSWTIPVETWSHLDDEEKTGWVPVYVYDYEYNENEKKRSIKLLNKTFLPQVKKEMTVLFK